MHRRPESLVDTLDPASYGADIKGATRSDQHSPHVDTLLAAGCNHSSDQIPGLKALDLLCPFRLGTREAEVVDIAFLPAPMSGCADQQRNHTNQLEPSRGTAAHTGRIHPMRLRQAPLCAVVLRQPS